MSFLEDQVDQRRGGDYTDDVFGDLARAIDDGSMEHEEIQGLTLLLIAAGMETTTSLLGTMVHSLATGAVTREELGDGVDLPTAAASMSSSGSMRPRNGSPASPPSPCRCTASSWRQGRGC